MKVYVVTDTYLDSRPILGIVSDAHLDQFKEKLMKEWEERIKRENAIIVSMDRRDFYEKEYDDGDFEVEAIAHRTMEGPAYKARYSANFAAVQMWEPK